MKILQYYQQKYIFTKTKVKYDTFFGQKTKNTSILKYKNTQILTENQEGRIRKNVKNKKIY